MLIAEKIMEKEFQSKTMKQAYLDCCKWVSTNIIAVNNSKHITYKVEKVKTDNWEQKILLTVYVVADEEEILERNCNICREVTSSFFMAQNKYMCEVCKVPSYRKRLMEKLKLIKDEMKGKIIK